MLFKNFFILIIYPFFALFNLIYSKPQLRILTFHHIKSEDKIKFQKLISYIKKKYKILSPKEFEEISQNKKKLSQDSVLFTFDDGYKSQYCIFKQILKAEKIKSIFFLTYNFIKINENKKILFFLKNRLKVNNERMLNLRNLSINDAKFLSKTNIIGSHTINHFDLAKINFLEKKKEIINSKDKLKKIFKSKKIDHFAYTFGQINNIDNKSLILVKKNYSYIHTGIRGNNYRNNSGIYYRDNCDLNQPFFKIIFFLKGYGDFLYFFKRIKLKELLKK